MHVFWYIPGIYFLSLFLRFELINFSSSNIGSGFIVYGKAVVQVLVLLFIALWFNLRGDLFYVLPCVILFLCFSVLLALRLPRLGKRES